MRVWPFGRPLCPYKTLQLGRGGGFVACPRRFGYVLKVIQNALIAAHEVAVLG
jgi:hypothetical protein